MLKWIAAGLVVAGLAAALILWYADSRWDAATRDLIERLRQSRRAPAAAAFSESQRDGLPAPVARYFRAVLRHGQPMITGALVRWAGEFNMGSPGADRWVPFTAEQHFMPGAPGMVWDARMRMAPGITVRVRDAFVDGAGVMYGAILGVVPVVDVRGNPGIAAGALQRYLGEAAWLPTALLPAAGVAWEAMTDSSARATVRGGGVSASVEFRFRPEGTIESSFVPDRLFDDGKNPPVPRPWQGRYLTYRMEQDMIVPHEAVVEWLLPGGSFAYWRGQPTAIEYEYAGP